MLLPTLLPMLMPMPAITVDKKPTRVGESDRVWSEGSKGWGATLISQSQQRPDDSNKQFENTVCFHILADTCNL